jgi:hypothetical protein
MEHFSNADVSVAAALSVLISNGEHEAAEQLRGVEVFTQEDAQLALSILRSLHLQYAESQNARNAAVNALVCAGARYTKPPEAA